MTPILRELYVKTHDLDLLKQHIGKMEKLYLPKPVGGAFLQINQPMWNQGWKMRLFMDGGERMGTA